MAVDSKEIDYIRCATQLAQSLRDHVPDCSICLVSDRDPGCSLFDHVRMIPGDRLPGFANDHYAFRLTPYHETIKIEADCVICEDVSHWWSLYRSRDVVISTGARDFYGNRSDCRYYRRVFDDNDLIDAYSAIVYWRRSELATRFHQTVRMIFGNWSEFKALLKFGPEQPNTDLVYAMAAELLGRQLVTLPDSVWQPRITHMKKHIVPISQSDWTQELVYETTDNALRINTVAQSGCLHYHIKDWVSHGQ